jgi:ribosomal protein S8
MKQTIFVLFLIIGLSFSENTFGQCDQQRAYMCAGEIAENAVYLRDFNTRLKNKKFRKLTGKKWKVILNKGTRYRFNVCTEQGYEDYIEMRLFKNQKDEFVIPLKVSELTKNNIYGFDYICEESGEYYVSIRFLRGIKRMHTCAVGIMSFVSKKKVN